MVDLRPRSYRTPDGALFRLVMLQRLLEAARAFDPMAMRTHTQTTTCGACGADENPHRTVRLLDAKWVQACAACGEPWYYAEHGIPKGIVQGGRARRGEPEILLEHAELDRIFSGLDAPSLRVYGLSIGIGEIGGLATDRDVAFEANRLWGGQRWTPRAVRDARARCRRYVEQELYRRGLLATDYEAA